MGTVRIDRVRTSGVFTLDGQSFDIENNIWPPETVVHTGHGDSTTIGDEAPHLDEWIARGH